jgi:hypothetical protein
VLVFPVRVLYHLLMEEFQVLVRPMMFQFLLLQ